MTRPGCLLALCAAVLAVSAYILHLRLDNASLRAANSAAQLVMAGQNATIHTLTKSTETTDRVTLDWSSRHADLADLSPRVATAIQDVPNADNTPCTLDAPLPDDITAPLRRMCNQARAGVGANTRSDNASESIHAVQGNPRPCLGFDKLTTRGLARLTAALYDHAGREGADKHAIRLWSMDMENSAQ